MLDFPKLIAEVEANFKPQYDHSKLEDKDLLVIYSVYTVQGCQGVCRTLATKNMAPFTTETAKKISHISHDPSPQNLASLYEIYPDERPLRFLVRLRLEKRHILEELDRRHRAFKVGRAFILIDEGKWAGDVKDFHKLLGVEKITSYKPQKEDSEDLKSEATVGAVKFFQNRGRTVIVKQRPGMPIPLLPADLGLPPRDPDPWGLWHRYNLDVYIERLAEDYLSLFFGGVDRVGEAARQALKNQWEKWEAQKRTGKEVILEETEGEIGSKSFKEWLEHQGVEEKGFPDISARMFRVLKEAQKHKRWGPQFINFAKYYLQSKPEAEAARLAKITDRTARNHIARLRKIFTPKK